MRGAALAGFAGAAIAVSPFLPWLRSPVGGALVPWDAMREVPPERWAELPVTGWMLAFAFAGGACLGVTGPLLRRAPRALVLLTGIAPYLAIGIEAARADSALRQGPFRGLYGDYGTEALQRLAGQVAEVAQIGFWLFFGGALTLFVLGLLAPSGRR